MAASRLCSAAAIAAAFTSMSMTQNRAYADSRFRFPFFSSSPPAEESPTDHKSSSNSKSETKPDSDEPKGSGFDPESLERGAKALREINSSPHSKQVFDLMRKQEKTRLAELAAEKEHNEAIQAHKDICKMIRQLAEDQRNLVQQQAQAKAQMLRYEDELARKRQQRLAGSSLLTLANKQDIQGALTPDEIGKVLNLESLDKSRHWKIVGCSAYTGEGLFEGFDWLVQDIASRIYMLINYCIALWLEADCQRNRYPSAVNSHLFPTGNARNGKAPGNNELRQTSSFRRCSPRRRRYLRQNQSGVWVTSSSLSDLLALWTFGSSMS